MTGNTGNGSGNGARSGAQTLVLLASPISVAILHALADGAQPQRELRLLAGTPAQTTMRVQLRRLADVGAIERQRKNRFPGAIEFELTAAGHDLLFVLDVLERWLATAPGGPLSVGDTSSRAAIKALAEGWSTGMLRTLAAGPRSLTELDGVIGSLNYPSLERRLAAMRLAGQIEATRNNGRGTPYAVTDWLRKGIAPIVAAARWERRHRSSASAPFGRLDGEALFLLAMPMVQLQTGAPGTCRLAIELPGKGQRLAGVMVDTENGQVKSCTTRLAGDADAWALGSATAWLATMIEGDQASLELGGDGRLIRSLLDGLHKALFSVRLRT